MRGLRCIFCGEEREPCIDQHHLIPAFLVGYWPRLKGKGGLLPICSNCHKIVHKVILGPIFVVLKEEFGEPNGDRWEKIREYAVKLKQEELAQASKR